MTNHCTPELFKAIDNLERRYPSVFKSQDKYSLDDVVPPLDPDFQVIKDFRNAIDVGDWEKFHTDRGMIADLASLLGRMTISQAAKELAIDRKTVRKLVQSSHDLKQIVTKRRYDFSHMIIYDRKRKKYDTASDMYHAAHKLGIPLASIKFYANDRHCKYWIKNRYKIKRKVWFDEDNGM